MQSRVIQNLSQQLRLLSAGWKMKRKPACVLQLRWQEHLVSSRPLRWNGVEGVRSVLHLSWVFISVVVFITELSGFWGAGIG
jgi:hypothetical protein